jgi:hypothetical protein
VRGDEQSVEAWRTSVSGERYPQKGFGIHGDLRSTTNREPWRRPFRVNHAAESTQHEETREMTELPMLTEIEYGPHKVTVRESFDDVRKLIEDNWGAERPFAVTNAAGGGRRLIRPQHIHSITEVPLQQQPQPSPPPHG